ncbi:2OG-Fe dioxygenase family protein [Sphingobium sp. HBC34]|uniref:2OG-Fe dioxygenase family protein n=1 Tax=Sphingobium cyanobacteriorum TaxID=3063954 RepID=A0ABT8ZLM4_9SPHN|nr:2OG-Fe dioxygenase family protein [Sphingobium sp. HBC34]MDO7835278.1 2OG-Fe dioxygenase family protein [Sphingobium sp. HBC34]
MHDTDSPSRIGYGLAQDGYARVPGAVLFDRLDIAEPQWAAFAASWNDLGPDLFMADGGRYRRRRHATFHCVAGRFTRMAHQPHYQSRDYNPLNGDVQRWFDPVEDATVASPVLTAILSFCVDSFDPARKGDWHVEMHQFRIEAKAHESGRPTPEGMHRDGVDHVLVMLIDRRNVREGVTRIGAPDGAPLGEFTLAEAGDTMLIDDRRIFHGVTEIHALDPAQPAWRDALVLTFANGRAPAR